MKICFVSPTNYPVLSGDRGLRQVGGAEVQQAILAREFARRGHEVSMICMDHGQDDGERIDGVTVWRAHTPDGGVPGLRFVHPRFTSLWRAMRRADADVYYQRTSAVLTAFVAAFARMHRRFSVFAAASDRDFLPGVTHLPYRRDRVLYRWGVRHVDLVIAQTETQREACLRGFGREATVIRSCYAHAGRSADQNGVVLWVANLSRHKRPEIFVELARRLPQLRFRMIGGADEAVLQALRKRAAGLSNLEFTGFVPFADIERQFDEGALLVNTSSHEGFPNTFLQAWSRGMPTVSFFDPHAQWEGQRVGCVVRSIDDMAAQVHALATDAPHWRAQGALARAYFGATFSVATAADAYENAFALARAPFALRPSTLESS
jgi:glycosyltransferase involved in cell wall biosynthesis